MAGGDSGPRLSRFMGCAKYAPAGITVVPAGAFSLQEGLSSRQWAPILRTWCQEMPMGAIFARASRPCLIAGQGLVIALELSPRPSRRRKFRPDSGSVNNALRTVAPHTKHQRKAPRESCPPCRESRGAFAFSVRRTPAPRFLVFARVWWPKHRDGCSFSAIGRVGDYLSTSPTCGFIFGISMTTYHSSK